VAHLERSAKKDEQAVVYIEQANSRDDLAVALWGSVAGRSLPAGRCLHELCFRLRIGKRKDEAPLSLGMDRRKRVSSARLLDNCGRYRWRRDLPRYLGYLDSQERAEDADPAASANAREWDVIRMGLPRSTSRLISGPLPARPRVAHL
jgi:hypothetical protein